MFTNRVDNPGRMNLQLFSEGGEGATAGTPAVSPQAAAPAAPQAQQTPSQPDAGAGQRFSSLSEYLQAKGYMGNGPAGAVTDPGPTQTAQPVSAQATPQPVQPAAVEPAQAQAQLYLNKFKTADDLAKSYEELEKWNHQLAQRHGLPQDAETQRNIVQLANQQSQEIARLTAMLQQNTQPAAQPGAQQPEQVLENSFGMSAEDFSDLLVTQPEKAMQLIQQQAQQAAGLKIQQWEQAQRQQQWQQEQKLENLSNQVMMTRVRYPDFDQFFSEIDQYMSQNPYLENLPNGVELAYKSLKADKLMAQPAPQSPTELLNDDNFRSMVLQDETIRQAVLRSHVEAVKNGQPPALISTNQSGATPAAAAEEIKSLDDAKRATVGLFNRMLGRTNQ